MHTRPLFLMLVVSTVGAATFSTLPGALKQILPIGQKAFKTKFVATTAQADALNAFGDSDFRDGDPFDVYYTKDLDGKITSIAILLEEYLPKWKSRHNFQLRLTNTTWISEDRMYTRTWNAPTLGFNLSRTYKI